MAKRWVSLMVARVDIPSNVVKMITKADRIEMEIQKKQEELEACLGGIVDTLGSPSFEHPTKGPMTIMARSGKRFWRAKPVGHAVRKRKAA